MAQTRSRALLLGLTTLVGLPALVSTTVPTAHAAAYDPSLTWRTLQTEHFNITFHGGEEALAEEVAATCELIWAEMGTELDRWPARRTEVVIVDNTDSANGYAMTLPVNTIVIYVTAPTEDSTLAQYEDWSDAIMTHEYTHILHIDTIEGLPRLLRLVLGRIVSVNNLSPGWIVEGQATFQETRHTNGGRGRSNIAHMVKRMAVLDDAFPPLGNMDGWQADPPGGNLRYLFGQDFAQYVADHTGRDLWTEYIHVYGGWVPYLLPAKRVFGESFLQLYKGWKSEMIARYEAQAEAARARGLTEVELLSDGVATCAGPTYNPQGSRIVWACSDRAEGSAIYVADGLGHDPEVDFKGAYADHFAWRPDGEAFAFATLHTVNRFNLYADTYLHKVGGNGAEPLTRGQRARDPAFSPDGRELLVVTNEVQNNQLARLTVDRKLTSLTEHEDHTQLSTPQFSPDGRHLALSMWRDGQRDIWITTTEGEPVRRVTADVAHDLDPAWSADGRTLFFSSDRTGIFNVYAVDLETEELRQITNVLGGAFHPSPSPDGTALLFESFANHGNDVVKMALDEDTGWPAGTLARPLEHRAPLAQVLPLEPLDFAEPWTPEEEEDEAELTPKEQRKKRRAERKAKRSRVEVDLQLTDADQYPGLDGLGGALHALPRSLPPMGMPGDDMRPRGEQPDQPGAVLDEDDVASVDLEEKSEEDYPFSYPVKRYDPVPTLLPPRYIVPLIYQTAFGLMGTLNTGGVDTLRRWGYSAYLSYRTDSRFVGWGGGLTWNRWIPVFSVGAYTQTVPYGDIFVYPGPPEDGGSWVPSIESNNQRYWERRTRLYGQVSHAIDDRRSIFARWAGDIRAPLDPIDATTYRPALPLRGFLSSVGGGWRYARGRSYAYSISPEKARIVSLVGEIYSPLIGSRVLDDNDQWVGFTQVQLTTEWREYKAVPWADNHVLAWKLAGGATLGDERRYGSYRLGGSFGEGAYYTLPDEWRSLRGFPTATVYGDWFYLGSLEYRLPLLRIDRGVGTIPAFARYLAASAFVDAGNAFDDPGQVAPLDIAASTRVGAGAELKGTAIIGWGVPITLRLGYAVPVYGAGGIRPGSLEGLYVWLGSSF